MSKLLCSFLMEHFQSIPLLLDSTSEQHANKNEFETKSFDMYIIHIFEIQKCYSLKYDRTPII